MPKTEVKFNDLPEWVKAESKKVMPHNHPASYISIGETVSFGMVTYDYARRVIVARNGQGRIMSVSSGYGRSAINMSKAEYAIYEGGEIQLTPDRTIVEIITAPPTLTMFLHPSNAPKLLPQKTELSEDEYAVLCVLVSRTSAGRKYEWDHYRVPQKWLSKRIESLADKGMVSVSKNGAVRVTVDGRNARKGIDDGLRFFRDGKHRV